MTPSIWELFKTIFGKPGLTVLALPLQEICIDLVYLLYKIIFVESVGFC